MKNKLKVCYFGVYDEEYSRNAVLLAGLRKSEVDIVECHETSGGLFKYWRLIRKFLEVRSEIDVVFVAFPAQLATCVVRIFTKKPIVMDAFFSMYESIVNERKQLSRWHPFSIFMAIVDWLSIRLADKLTVDTEAHSRFWQEWGIKPEKIHKVPVGNLSTQFYPIEDKKTPGKFLVHFHGTYIPLQGIECIIRAASLLKDRSDIHFRLVGTGQTYDAIRKEAKELNLTNVTFVERVSIEELNKIQNEADLTLGVFGKTRKTELVIPNKVYQALATRKPLITADNVAIREEIDDCHACLIESTPEALADAIVRLYEDPVKRKSLAEAGYKLYLERFTEEKVADSLLMLLNKLVKNV